MTEARMREIVEVLARPEGRAVGSAGHDRARDWLCQELDRARLVPYGDAESFRLPYPGDRHEFDNVLGVLPGKDRALPPILLAAHYDTCGPLPGADDNAAAIAIALTLVEPLRAAGLSRDVVLAFFDAEEPPHYLTLEMGSTRFYFTQRKGPLHCAIVLDLVGHDVPIPGYEDLLFVTGMESDPSWEPIFRTAAEVAESAEPSVRSVTTLTRYIGDMSDYHAIRVDEKPFLFLSCAQWEHYHSAEDTPEKLNYSKMATIRTFLQRAIREADRAPFDGPFEGYDTTATEIETLRRVFAGFPLVGEDLSTREDIDALTAGLMRSFGLL